MNKFPADNPFSKIQAFKSAIALSLIINIILMMGILYPDTRDFIRFLGDNGVKLGLFSCSLFICNLLLFFILFLFSFRFAKKGNESTKSAIKLTLGILLITLILSPSLSQFQWQIIQGNTVHGASEFTLFFLVKDLISGFVVMLITAIINLGDKQKQALITNQQLVAENMKVKYEALRNQLDPHFLFNSLNTLNGLIDFSSEKAHEYLDNLSSVFRYTLHSKNIVILENEIEFVNAYVSMLQIRFGENIEVCYNIDNKYKSYYIMPISLQLLVENAVKHNTISNKKKLIININTTDDSIVVSNIINPKAEKNIGGVGLANLIERYKILFDKKVTITDTDGIFSVAIPLVAEIDKKINI